MKTHTSLIALILVCLFSVPARAQYLGTNSFAGDASISGLFQYTIDTNTGTYSATPGYLEYTASVAASANVLTMNNTVNSAYTQDWTAKLTLSNLTTPASGFNLIGLQVFSATQNYGFFNIGLYRHADGTSGVLFEKARNATNNPANYVWTSYISTQADLSDVLVVMSHNATTKDVTLGYSLDGGATYHQDTVTFNPTSTADGGAWFTAPTDGYSFRILARNTGEAIGAGEMFADNFAVTAGVTAVPEPSTYAALAGLGALGLALWHRRRKAAV